MKIIDYGKIWTCENMDNLAPINWEGYKVLFSDGSIKIINDLSEIKEYKKASDEEVKDFYRERNFIFIGDEVEIINGRKLPISEHKIVKDFYEYTPVDTYGHHKVYYLVFTDGSKTVVSNVRNVKCTNNDTAKVFKRGYDLSGRV